ncbi:MAG: hypothetical protein Q4B52_07625 [Tissierellia bacterium]|nr:hypothetical protein [Tissierellia bacterium]
MRNIVAILPYKIPKIGLGSCIYYTEGYEIVEKIPTNILKNQCDLNNVNRRSWIKKLREEFDIKRNYPWIIRHDMVFFGFKFRESAIDDQRAFVNTLFVERIDESEIILTTNEKISTLNTRKTMLNKYIEAEFFRMRLALDYLISLNDVKNLKSPL